MRIRAAALAAALIAAQAGAAGAQPPPAVAAAAEGEARAILAAVLAYEGAEPRREGAARACVVAEMAEPLRAEREFSRWTREVEAVAEPGREESADRQWFVPGPPRPPRHPAEVDRALARRLNAALGALLQATQAAAPGRIDAALLPASLAMRRGDEDCATIALAAPALAGDLAFVESAYVCGGLCGNGSLYALRRREGRWAIVGVARTWVS